MSSAPSESTLLSQYQDERERELSDVASDTRESSPLVRSNSISNDYEIIPPRGAGGERPSVPRRLKPLAARVRDRSTWSGSAGYEPPTISIHRSSYRTIDEEEATNIQSQYDKEGYRTVLLRPAESTEGIATDGRLSTSMSIIGDSDYVSLDALGNNAMTTTKALTMCTKYVLSPYHIFLKIVGWRGFHSPRAHGSSWYNKCFNVFYPTFIFLMIAFACIAQIASCFSRSLSHSPCVINDTHSILLCKENLITGTVIGDILIITSYLWAFYIYRFSESEHLSKLIQTVFLSCTSKLVHNSPKRLVFILLSYLLFGFIWIVFSFAASFARIFALRLNQEHTYIDWFLEQPATCNSDSLINANRYNGIHYFLVAMSLIGFIFFDLLYIAIVINYITQCELLRFFIRNIREKVVTKEYLLGYAVKELYHVNEYLRVLNGKFSYITSLILFVFLQELILSYGSLMTVQKGESINIFVGVTNVLQWLTLTIILVIQASRLTAECNGIRKLGLEIGARPFVYSDTPQLVLDSFVLYTSSTNYKAKLAFIPMYPSLVFGFFFVAGIFLTTYPGVTNFDFAQWL